MISNLVSCLAYDDLRAGLLSAGNFELLGPKIKVSEQVSIIIRNENTAVIRREIIINANKL